MLFSHYCHTMRSSERQVIGQLLVIFPAVFGPTLNPRGFSAASAAILVSFREGKAIKSAFGIQARINEPCPTLAASKFQMGIKAIVFKLAALCSNLCQLTVCMIDLDLLTFKGINWGGGMYLRLDSLTSGLGPPSPTAAHSVLPSARTPAIDRPGNSNIRPHAMRGRTE